MVEPTLNLTRERILFIDHTAAWGGGEIALFNLVTSLDWERFEPSVLLFADGMLRTKLSEMGVPVTVMPLSTAVTEVRKDALGSGFFGHAATAMRALAFVFRLTRRLRANPPDLIHTNSLKADILAGLAARLAGVPVVWHVRDRIADDYLPRRVATVFRQLARWIPNYVIANSNATLQTLDIKASKTRSTAIYSGLSPDKVHRQLVIHDGVDLDDLPAEQEMAVRDTNATTLQVGLIGRISPWKGQHVFVRAAGIVHERFPACRFLIVGSALFGEDEYDAEVRALVGRLGLSNAVEFLGFRNDVPALVAGLDVLVHASTTGEPFGQVIVEGMAAGKPVVATNGGGVPEIVDDGVTGLLVPMGEAAGMAAAIERLLGDAGLRQSMGHAGRQRVAERFTIERTARDVEAVYGRVLGPGRPVTVR